MTEDHALRNGVHFADYIRRVDVPGSKHAFALRGQQVRYLTIDPNDQRAAFQAGTKLLNQPTDPSSSRRRRGGSQHPPGPRRA